MFCSHVLSRSRWIWLRWQLQEIIFWLFACILGRTTTMCSDIFMHFSPFTGMVVVHKMNRKLWVVDVSTKLRVHCFLLFRVYAYVHVRDLHYCTFTPRIFISEWKTCFNFLFFRLFLSFVRSMSATFIFRIMNNTENNNINSSIKIFVLGSSSHSAYYSTYVPAGNGFIIIYYYYFRCVYYFTKNNVRYVTYLQYISL